MNGFLYNLGKKAAPTVLKTRWVYRSITGTASEKIQAAYSMGCYLASLHIQSAPLEEDPEIRRWLTALSQQLAKTLVNQERRFQVRCLADAQPNAFALPGGFIFISRSLLDLCDFDPDETAFVLAHEMAHILRSHSINRLLTSEVVQLLSRGTPLQGVLRPVLARVIKQLVNQGYSRGQEFEADAAAIQITRVAGYNPEGAIRLFRRLQTCTTQTEGLANYFSSHPPFSQRIDRIQKSLTRMQ